MKLLSLLTEYLGGGGYIQISANTPRLITFGKATIEAKELWGRINIAPDKAVFQFDEETVRPKPKFSVKVLGVEIASGTINGLTITDASVVAQTSSGDHDIWP